MSLIILNLRHYNTPGTRKSEGIVQPSSNIGYMDRLLNHKYHHRDRHGFGHFAESSAGDRGRSHYHRCGNERGSQGLSFNRIGIQQSQISSDKTDGDPGDTIPGIPFSICSSRRCVDA